jgi:MscS family membrane protein
MASWTNLLSQKMVLQDIVWTLVVMVVAWAAAQIYILIIERLLRPWASRTASQLDDRVVDAIRRPGYLFILLVGCYAALHRFKFGLLPFLDGVLFVLGVGISIYTVTIIAVIVLEWYGEGIAGEKEGETVARELLPLADKSLKLILLVVGLVIVLDHFSIDIKSILVTLGVGSLAVGLALQDTLANMFGGFTIMLDRRFKIGHRIQLQSGELGDVLSIGLRSTTALTPEGHTLIVPNSIMVRTIVTNLSSPDTRTRLVVEIGIAQGSDSEKAKKLMLESAVACSNIVANPPPVALFSSFGPSVLNVRLVCYVGSFLDSGLAADFLNTRIHAAFRSAGIEVPHPGRNIFVKPNSEIPV